MKKMFLSALIPLLAISTAWASKEINYNCPNVELIKSLGLDSTSIYNDGSYYAVSKKDTYGTSHLWTFHIWKIYASSNKDALFKANATLTSLSGTPQAEYANGFMDCLYNNENGYITDAYTKYVG